MAVARVAGRGRKESAMVQRANGLARASAAYCKFIVN
jgi:hypothetical protein